jgi:MYXO-CTERM domain-containing protein
VAEREPDDGPYPDEVRNEVWQAIANGATAVGYFTHSWECPGYTQFCLTAEQEAELIRTNGQLTALSAQILSPRYGEQVTVTASGQARVDWIAKVHDGRVYLFAVNVERDATSVSFDVVGMAPDSHVEVVDEARSLQAAGESFEDDFDALQVHIYAFDLAPPPGEGGGGSGAGGGGGATGGAGGQAGGGAAPAAQADSDDGCDCSAVGRRGSSRAVWALALMAMVLAARIRRRVAGRGRRCAVA